MYKLDMASQPTTVQMYTYSSVGIILIASGTECQLELQSVEHLSPMAYYVHALI